MFAVHNSRALCYRKPYGAVAIDTAVQFSLRIDAQGDNIQAVYLCYAYGLDRFQESRLRMRSHLLGEAENQEADGNKTERPLWFRAICDMPSEPGLFFYWFEIQVNNSKTWYTADLERKDGSGRFSPTRPSFQPGESMTPAPFQVTVHLSGFSVPNWLPGAVMYQIFPDRFNRGSDYSYERMVSLGDYPERIWHEDWNSEVDIHGKSETGYIACDFYGGSLRGIIEKLDYIANLGIDVIYLNPIFRARSNHRYDTGDYEQIDPLVGTEDDLRELCSLAQDRGIRVMLDGVFSHTGADSRYFNKLNRYDSNGAWQEAVDNNGEKHCSDYSSWYNFHRRGNDLFYDSWWGFPDLPSVNEHDLTYRHYMTGDNGIIAKWLSAGVSGWRLDVSDELPDSFLRDVRRSALKARPDAAILGEVWEDASRKVSYGHYRDFIYGRTHDCIMGYPFRNALVDWLAGHHSAEAMFNDLEIIREHYPVVSFYSSMNLISSHDIPRAITAIVGLPDPGSREAQMKTKLSPAARIRGEKLMRLAVLFQIAYPGMASIYYGDETGMEGYRDPFNRRPYPWNKQNTDLIAWFSQVGKLRSEHQVLKTGHYLPLLAQNDLFVFERTLDLENKDVFGFLSGGSTSVIAAFNRSPEKRSCRVLGRTIELEGYSGQLEFADGYIVRTAGMAE
jgi:4-alpha-glucanotransferase